MLVDFMIIGAQKCGTTTLFDILNSHPSLEGCKYKEPHFFCTASNWRDELARYEQLFEPKPDVMYFEASTTYTFYPLRNLRIWDDLFAYNPLLKLIYIVRDPISRIVSSYMHTYERGYTDLNIEDAIRKQRLFIDITRYYTQIYPFIKTFGRDNVLIVDFDDLIHSREQVIQEISDFLAIDYSLFTDYQDTHSNISIAESKIHHKFDHPPLPLRAIRKFLPPIWAQITDNSDRQFSTKPKLTFEFKTMILTMLELEIKELETLMNKDLSKWLLLEEPLLVN